VPELPPALKIRDLKQNDWALPKETLAELDAHLRRRRPMHIVEFGSGQSTVVLAEYARDFGAKVTTFEHDAKFLRRTEQLLGPLRRHVTLRWGPLAGTPPMYDARMPDLFDFALIDGPPSGTGGRAATFPALMGIDHGPDAEVWLDDGARVEEIIAVGDWLLQFGGWKHQLHSLPHGLIRLGRHLAPAKVDGEGVTITILTGSRPQLFDDTWTHLPGSLVETADRIVVLVNGADRETMAMADGLTTLPNVIVLTTPEILPMGEAMGLLAAHTKSPFWLHLEDDWRYVTTYDGWLDNAREILDSEPDVAQVRLRHSYETVLKRNQVTGKPLLWRPHRLGLRCDDSHLTTNPMLARTEQFEELWPCAGEKTMQRIARERHLTSVVQLHPGAFVHTGGSDSLRARTGD
jgi:hypothetical protein